MLVRKVSLSDSAGAKRLSGHCRVPVKYRQNEFNLGQWVGDQRRSKEEMLPERIKQLDDLGFVWDVLNQQWEEGFAALEEFKAAHRHCRVPADYKQSGYKLGSWVRRQRKDEMPPERIKRLDDLGFVWVARKTY